MVIPVSARAPPAPRRGCSRASSPSTSATAARRERPPGTPRAPPGTRPRAGSSSRPARRDVDVDPWPDLDARPAARDRALRLAQHVVGREALFDDAIELLLVILLDAVGEVQGLLGCQVREQRRMDVSNVLRKARAAAVVVHHHLQEVRIVAELGVILLRAVER